jgi:hypothetical protein
MTSSAIVKQADLRRMASIAKKEGVTVSIEINGRIITISPEKNNETTVDTAVSFGGNSLSAWRARHEGKSGGNSPRQKNAR